MKNQAPKPSLSCGSIHDAIVGMCDRLRPLDSEPVPLGECAGRILAEAIKADRPSPACDVSAMDGYAVRMAHLKTESMAIAGEAAIGQPPGMMPERAVLRIFTGAPVPAECDAVIPREQVVEHPEHIEMSAGLNVVAGQHIRRCGENGDAGEIVVEAGMPITSPVAAALAAFGVTAPRVCRRVRLGVIVTGNEIRAIDQTVEPWHLRDSNGHALAAMFAGAAWIDIRFTIQVKDEPVRLKDVIGKALDEIDALLLTGGVSMGDYDFVPAVLSELGCEIVFHKLPIRPGKPMLGAIGPRGQAIMGLPGNPVSVMTTARCIAAPILRHVAGHVATEPSPVLTRVRNADDKRIALQWLRPVRHCGNGQVELIDTRGSGDIVSAARSDGLIMIPPHQAGPGPWPFISWSLRDD